MNEGYTALQAHNSAIDHWRSEAEHATPRSQGLPTMLNLYEWAGMKRLYQWNLNARAGNKRPRQRQRTALYHKNDRMIKKRLKGQANYYWKTVRWFY